MLGNPQLGVADPNNPHPPVVDGSGKVLYPLSICQLCNGYFAAQCP